MAHCNIYANIIWQTKEAKENRWCSKEHKRVSYNANKRQGSRFVYPERKLSTFWTSQFLKDVSVPPYNAVCLSVQSFVVFVEFMLRHLLTKYPTPRLTIQLHSLRSIRLPLCVKRAFTKKTRRVSSDTSQIALTAVFYHGKWYEPLTRPINRLHGKIR